MSNSQPDKNSSKYLKFNEGNSATPISKVDLLILLRHHVIKAQLSSRQSFTTDDSGPPSVKKHRTRWKYFFRLDDSAFSFHYTHRPPNLITSRDWARKCFEAW
ncbi:hypothetical protein TNCT_364041 [Trichonephila clavata]|uniref:Uncharacterized protein n=1 Tax=Trichonephila clavata TaxID=2740835 RepID=A0A8X6HL75_TRICU|nr:hypothetical protein TNCT_364041 [Trichonephila clavata]